MTEEDVAKKLLQAGYPQTPTVINLLHAACIESKENAFPLTVFEACLAVKLLGARLVFSKLTESPYHFYVDAYNPEL